ncbi:hypothetical protein BH11PAT3_BH11PAT3_0470 [soil metagenome]
MAKRKTGEKPAGVDYRTQVFGVNLDVESLHAVLGVSDILRQVWNEALKHRLDSFAEHLAPLYEKLRAAKENSMLVFDRLTHLRMIVPPKLAQEIIKDRLKATWKEEGVTFNDQVNALTYCRAGSDWGDVNSNWPEETLDRLKGGFSSFMKLRKNGDYDARPTTRFVPEGHFVEITGRSGFKLKDGHIILSPGKIAGGQKISFPVPEYQWERIQEAKRDEKGNLRIKKFRLHRSERDLSRPGIWKINISYEIEIPETSHYAADDLVFVSIGASYIGIASAYGEETIALARPDEYFKPEIDKIVARMEKCMKGSKRWERLNVARKRNYRTMSVQQKQDHREIVKNELLEHGTHFVITDYVVRSKRGKLADHEQVERRGSLGLNWQAQNTGSFADLVSWLEIKARERGGSVTRVRVPVEGDLPGLTEAEMISQALALKDQYHVSLEVGKVS